jgi:hypothetical protein
MKKAAQVIAFLFAYAIIVKLNQKFPIHSDWFIWLAFLSGYIGGLFGTLNETK